MEITEFRDGLNEHCDKIIEAYKSLGSFIEKSNILISEEDHEMVEGFILSRMKRLEKQLVEI